MSIFIHIQVNVYPLSLSKNGSVLCMYGAVILKKKNFMHKYSNEIQRNTMKYFISLYLLPLHTAKFTIAFPH